MRNPEQRDVAILFNASNETSEFGRRKYFPSLSLEWTSTTVMWSTYNLAVTPPTGDNEAAVSTAKRFFQSAKSAFGVKKRLSYGLGGTRPNTSKYICSPMSGEMGYS
jgi:hypothetical protein